MNRVFNIRIFFGIIITLVFLSNAGIPPWEAEELIPTPAGCTLKWKARIPVNGDEITEYGLDILEIRDGRISRNEVFFDRLNWLSKLQQS